jgi:hypothetical protein
MQPSVHIPTPMFLLKWVGALFLLIAAAEKVSSFSVGVVSMSASPHNKDIYGIPNAKWAAKREWNWGSAIGTGHDAAMICRNKYDSPAVREALVDALIAAPDTEVSDRKPTNFEEVKLILGLAWQRGRWDGSDGGRGGYGDVLAVMAQAERYESTSEEESSRHLVIDMKDRFHLLRPSEDDLEEINNLVSYLKSDSDAARRKCSGLVLKAMDFIENGL